MAKGDMGTQTQRKKQMGDEAAGRLLLRSLPISKATGIGSWQFSSSRPLGLSEIHRSWAKNWQAKTIEKVASKDKRESGKQRQKGNVAGG